MDFSNLKAELIKRYAQNKSFLSSLDLWSQIEDLNYFTFKVSQVTYRYIKNNKDLAVSEERVASGKLSFFVTVPEMKFDDFLINTIEVIQDVEVKSEEILYVSASYNVKEDFNTRNSLKAKPLRIFDVRCTDNTLTMRVEMTTSEYIELALTR